MKQFVFVLAATVLVTFSLESQNHQRYWIFFTDGDNAPLSERNIEVVRSITDSITVMSRWLNAVSAPATAGQLESIRTLPFVKSVQPVARMARPRPVPEPRETDDLQKQFPTAENFYGISETQIKMHRIDVLHNADITGEGAIIGFLDTGYDWESHTALKDAKVIAERDFVAEHYSEQQLPAGHYSHGTLVFSVVAGYDPDTFIGVAHDAQFLLGATEDIRTETPIEEDFWVAGIEWMEEMEVNIVSTSLGYSTFDPPHESYTPEDMDGRTAVTTIAADRAFEREILVVASAGNAGNSDWRIITSPADGEYVIAVGAIDAFENIALFSSRGPSADGRIKPDIAALGVTVAGARVGGTSGYRFASGTSLSAPIVSGTAGLILSARPDLSAGELRNALLMSARRNSEPDNTVGYGMLDAPDALAFPVKRVINGGAVAIEAFLTAKEGLIEETVSVHLRTTSDPVYSVYPFTISGQMAQSTSGLYRHILGERYRGQTVRFVITARDSSGNTIRYPQSVSKEFFLSPVHDLVTITDRVIPERFVLHQNFPNPFNDRTVIRFELPDDDHVAIRVYDILGRNVVSLSDDFYLAGVHEVTWRPSVQSSGVYFYTLRYGNRIETGRMLYLR